MDAAKGYVTHLDEGGKMMITPGRRYGVPPNKPQPGRDDPPDKVSIISCTGANLEGIS